MLISLGVVERWQSSVADSAAASSPSLTAAVSAAAHQSSIGGTPAADVVLTAENLTQAVIILILDVVIICSNLLIIATLATGSGQFNCFLHSFLWNLQLVICIKIMSVVLNFEVQSLIVLGPLAF